MGWEELENEAWPAVWALAPPIPDYVEIQGDSTMTSHRIGTREEWLAASAGLLEREKELTRMGDELARQRRELPWVPVEKEYTLQTEDGTRTLAELFDGRSQLVVYHFMFGPDYEGGCPSCSSTADSFNGVLAHLQARDVTMICVSRAPLDKLLAAPGPPQSSAGCLLACCLWLRPGTWIDANSQVEDAAIWAAVGRLTPLRRRSGAA